MQQDAHESGAAADLSRQLQLGSTGRLSTQVRGVDLDLYLMNRQVVAAESSDDIKLLLRRLYAAKALSRARVTELGNLSDMGESVFGLLLEEVDTELMEKALFDRFRDNVSRFLGVRAPAQFHPMSAVFVENFQMGHNTEELLLACAKTWRLSRYIPLSMVLRSVHPEDATKQQVPLVERLDGERTVRQILHDVPVEPLFGRAVLAQMLSNGIVERVEIPTEPPPLEREYVPPPEDYAEANTTVTNLAELRATAPDPLETQETELIESEPIGPGPATEEVDDLPDDIDLDETEVVELHVSEVNAPEGVESSWPHFMGPTSDQGLPPEDDHADELREFELASTDQGHHEDEDEPNTWMSSGYEEPNTWMSTDPNEPSPFAQGNFGIDTGLDDSLMEAFADHDQVRGGEADGSFSTAELDRVEVAVAPDEDEVIEVDEVPASRLAARILSTADAERKLAVTNDALQSIAEGFDNASGSGRGRAAIQLLIEGCPSKFSPLFHDARVRNDGSLPIDHLMRNLQVRPATEHRQLLNQGLMDLIDRGMSLALDEIEDDDAIDAILDATGGFRQRLGL